MPVNTFGSNLRVETATAQGMIDNDEFIRQKNHAEHSEPEISEPWTKSHRAKEEAARAYLEAQQHPVEDDPQLRAANTQDLKIRNLNK